MKTDLLLIAYWLTLIPTIPAICLKHWLGKRRGEFVGTLKAELYYQFCTLPYLLANKE